MKMDKPNFSQSGPLIFIQSAYMHASA